MSDTSDIVVSDADGLTEKYPFAWSDFYPNRTPCVYKSGPVWEVPNEFLGWPIEREPRPICRPDIAPIWVSILQKIVECLDSVGVKFTSINAFSWANRDEKELLCPFLLFAGVIPQSLDYDDAVTAAVGVKAILTEYGLPEAEVAFVEMVNKCLSGGPELLSLKPFEKIAEYRKPSTSVLGLPIARLDMPYYEGTGALYFRLDTDTEDIALLTCADVVRPPPAFLKSHGMKRTDESQPKELVIALGIQDYNTPEPRPVGWVMYSSSSTMQVPGQPLGYTEDWGFVRMDPGMIDKQSFSGNKVFMGGKFPGREKELTFLDLIGFLFPGPEDTSDCPDLYDLLLQARGVVSASEISSPNHVDDRGQPCLIVAKNGPSTGTTFGRVNGLESVKRTYAYSEHDGGITKQDSLEIAVLWSRRRYDNWRGTFSAAGDSGSIVLTREGKILGMLTGGAAPPSRTETDVTWVTPFWWLQERIKEQYPGAVLYDTGR